VLTRFWTGSLLLAVVAAVVLQLAAPGSAAVAVISGFVLVVAGTVLVARVSHTPAALPALIATLRELRLARRARSEGVLQIQSFLQAATFFRYGNIRPAEEAARAIPDPVLRRGTQMVIDGFQRPQLAIGLQRQIAEERERLMRPVELLRAMAGYAPSLGMFGTLLGLLQMLFGAEGGDVSRMGAAMGFAMMTTVYGLVFANLLLKPLAAQIEQRNRRYLAVSLMAVQAVVMLYERQHPQYMRDVLNNVRVSNAPASSGGFSNVVGFAR
jgi:chemotaxis protein MotA